MPAGEAVSNPAFRRAVWGIWVRPAHTSSRNQLAGRCAPLLPRLVDLTGSAEARFQRPFHPSRPRGRVLAGKMHPALWGDDVRKECLHLAGSEIRECAARPGVLVPALRHPALEVFGEPGKDLLQLRKRELEPVCFRHPGHAPTVHPGRQRLEDPARTWLAYRVL